MRPGLSFIAFAFAFAVAAHDDDGDVPRLRERVENAGPDGNVAFHGVLAAAFCFKGPDVCLPAGSVVDFTTSTPGPHADPGAQPTGPTLRRFRAPKTIALRGFHFAGGHDVDVFGDRVSGVLAKHGVVFGYDVAAGFFVDVDRDAVSFERRKGRGVAVATDGRLLARVTTLQTTRAAPDLRTTVATVVGAVSFAGVSFDGVVTVVEDGGVVEAVCGAAGCVCKDGHVVAAADACRSR